MANKLPVPIAPISVIDKGLVTTDPGITNSLLASIISYSNDAILSKTLDGIITSWNEGAELLFGYTAEEAIGQSIYMLIPYDRHGEEKELIQKIKRGEMVRHYETVRLHKDGSAIDISITVSPIKDLNGTIIGASKIARNISGQKKIAAQLAKSEKEYRTLFENNPLPMWVIDTTRFKFLRVNDSAIHHYGYSRAEFEAMSTFDIRPEEEREKYIQYNKMPITGPNREGIWKHIKKDGTIIDVEVHADDILYDNQPARLVLIHDITEKLKTKAELEKSEIRLQTTLDQMLEGIQIIDFNWRYVYVNDTITKHGRNAKEELLGYTMIEKYPGIETTETFKILKRSMIDRIPQQVENEFAYPDNTKAWFELSIQPVPEGIFILSIDITERKKGEEKFRKEKELSDSTINSLPGIFYLFDTNGKFLRWNKNFETISGYNADEIAQMHPLDFFDLDEKARVAEKISEVFTTGEDSVEANFLTKSRQKIPFYFTGKIQQYEDNQCLLGVGIDISERKRAEESLAKSEKQFRTTLDNLLEGIQIYDNDWNCLYVNDAVTRQGPYSKEEIQAKTLLENYPGIETTELFRIFSACMANHESRHIEYEFTFPDNSSKWFELSLQPIPEGLFILSIDISDRKKAEADLLELNEQLRSLTSHLQTIREEERTHIAREIHDELGQQLTVLKMDISTLRNKTKIEFPAISAKTEDMIAMVNAAIRTIPEIVIELRPGILDDLGLIAALEWQAKEFEQRTEIGCKFATTLTSDNFSKDMNTAVFRIFQESLTNVVRHTKATQVEANLSQQNQVLILEIVDNGTGITEERKNNKTSFGLLGMKERAAILNGEFTIKKLPQGGTAVTLKIPLPS